MEIDRLQGLEKQQGYALVQRINSPLKLFSTIFSLFSGQHEGESAKGGSFLHQDIVGLLSRFLLPLTLNKTLFRNSGFIVKTLVSLASQKASHFINEDSIAGVWDKVKSLFSKTHEQTPEHRGVPAFSETY
jgi:hypothetical protein